MAGKVSTVIKWLIFARHCLVRTLNRVFQQLTIIFVIVCLVSKAKIVKNVLNFLKLLYFHLSGIENCIGQCLNGGKCVNLNNSFHCACLNGFTGEFCQNQFDECLLFGNSICLNGGKCKVENENTKCICTSGFKGDYCQIQTDFCVNHSCLNGKCLSIIDDFYCDCQEGWIGRMCDQQIAKTEVMEKCVHWPCYHSGVCTIVNNQPKLINILITHI